LTVEKQNYYEVVQPLLYITYCGFIYDVTLWRSWFVGYILAGAQCCSWSIFGHQAK